LQERAKSNVVIVSVRSTVRRLAQPASDVIVVADLGMEVVAEVGAVALVAKEAASLAAT